MKKLNYSDYFVLFYSIGKAQQAVEWTELSISHVVGTSLLDKQDSLAHCVLSVIIEDTDLVCCHNPVNLVRQQDTCTIQKSRSHK